MGRMKDLLITIYGGGNDAVAAAEKLAGISRWIHINERLPEDGRYIVFRQIPGGNSYIDIAILFVDAGHEAGLSPLPSLMHVTHWMPLPEPPAKCDVK